MNDFISNLIWSMHPAAFITMMARINAVNFNDYSSKSNDSDPAAMLPEVFSGTASDAERNGFPVQVIGNVAVISIKGPMIKNDSFFARYFGFTSTLSIRRAVESATNDQNIKLIFIIVESPGGSVDGVPELSDAIAKAKKEKDVIVQVDGLMASAAYWAVSNATKIYSGRYDLIGSIGARMQLIDSSEMFKQQGLKAITIDTGDFKSAGASGTVITEEQISDFQRIVDGFFTDFIGSTMAGRDLSKKQVMEFADGRMFFPKEAIGFGLIDGIKQTDQAVSSIISKTNSRRRTTASAKNIIQVINI